MASAKVGSPTQILMLVLDGQLAGDHRRPRSNAIVEHFEQIGSFLRRRRRQPPIVDQQEIKLGQRRQAFAESFCEHPLDRYADARRRACRG
jgi:hypothetical protein